jgi:hypothetical protein
MKLWSASARHEFRLGGEVRLVMIACLVAKSSVQHGMLRGDQRTRTD